MKRRKHFWLTRVAVLATVVAFFAACDDDTTGPGLEDVDPAGTAAVVGEVVSSLEDNESLQSYNVLGDFVGAAFGGATPVSFPFAADATLPQSLGTLSRRLASCGLREPGATLAGPIIGTDIGGTVFVWDFDTGQGYIPSQDQVDSETVRFILYQVTVTFDPFGEPVVEVGDRVGYVDFIDTSDETANKLRIMVVPDATGEPVVDYEVSCAVVTGGVEVAGQGFITDGVTTVTLDLSVGIDQSGAVVIDFNLDVDPQNVQIYFHAEAPSFEEFDDPQGTFTAEFAITRNNSIEFELEATEGALSGSVLFCDATGNCATAALISGTFEEPLITDAAGNELSPEAIAALGQLFDGIGEFAENLFPMLAPAFEICFPL